MKQKITDSGTFNLRYELIKKFFYKTGVKVTANRKDEERNFEMLKIYHV